MVPTSRWVVGAIAAGLAFMLVAAVIWATTDDRLSADPEVASDECATSAICHESGGVASFCNLATHRCQSVVSEICPEYFPVEAGTDPSAIAIGTIFDRSTPNQLARAHAAELAALGVNQGGGIDGRRVLLIHCDASNGRAAAAADQLARAGVTAVVGPSTSSDVEAAFAAHADDEMLFISPSATATQLTAIDTGTPGLLWRTTPPDSLQSKVILSDLLAEPPATSLAVVRRANDVYAQSLSVILQESAREAGLVVDASEVFANAEAVPDVIDGAIESDPDAIVFLTSHIADAAAFLDAASAHRGYRGKLIYFADAAANDDLFALATRGAPLFGAIRATRPAAPSTIITTEFASDYMAANGGEDPLQFSFTAHTYDATLLVMLGAAYALRDGGELTGDRIAEGLALMSSGTEEHRLLAANIRATIAAIRSAHPNVDVVGASGDLDFDPITEELESGSYEILEVRGDPPRFVVARRVDVPE
jgi:branched-chain amino acid transport system substrate-binding protein